MARGAATDPAADSLEGDRLARHVIPAKTAVAIAYVASLFMSAMDNHIVNVMLPTLSRTFHAPLASAQWTAIGYVLSLAVFIPASGWLGDRIGSKRAFIAALVIFTLSSAACGQARSLTELVTFRILQGAGGGMLTPVATSMLYRAYPPAERARMTRILVVPILLGPILAQPVGGLLVTDLSWRYAFYLNVPIGLAALAVAVTSLVEYRSPERRRFDLPGFVLSGGGLSLVLYAISEGSLEGWGSPDVVATGLVGLAALVCFVLVEQRSAAPLLNIRLFSDRIFAATNLVAVWNNAAFSGLLYLAPIFLQEAKGESALDAGLTSFCTAIGVMCASQTVGRIYPRIGPRRMAAVGQLGLGLMLVSFVLIGSGTSLWWVRLTLFLAGCGNSGTMIAIQTSMFSTVSSSDTSYGAAIFNAGRQSSAAVGIAVFTTIIASAGGTRLHAFHVTFVAAALFALVASVIAFVAIHDVDAAATMRTVPREPSAASE